MTESPEIHPVLTPAVRHRHTHKEEVQIDLGGYLQPWVRSAAVCSSPNGLAGQYISAPGSDIALSHSRNMHENYKNMGKDYYDHVEPGNSGEDSVWAHYVRCCTLPN